MSFAAKVLLALLVIALCATVLQAQTIQIMLIDGKTGRPITYSSLGSLRTILYVWPGLESELTLLMRADKHGVALLHLIDNDSGINVPDCKGMHADSENFR